MLIEDIQAIIHKQTQYLATKNIIKKKLKIIISETTKKLEAKCLNLSIQIKSILDQ